MTAEEQLLLRGRLLKRYLKDVGSFGVALERTALRSESIHMRELIAAAASHGTLTFSELRNQVTDDSVSAYSLDPVALGRLAHVVALQDAGPDDTGFATKALELATPHLGSANPAGRFRKLLAELYFEQRRFDKLEALIADRPELRNHFYSYLWVDSQSPFVRHDLDVEGYETWLERFNRQFTRNDLSPIFLRDGEDAPFNRLTSNPAAGPQPQGPLVTVIMTSFKPKREDVLQSARSILEQSWKHLELLVVDDASPAEYACVLDELEGLDDRVRVVRLEVNGGTYVARNAGIAQARGDFVTGQDADDWSHPQRIQTQVNHLIRNQDRPGNQVYTVNMTEDLVRIRRGYSPFIPSAPTLMVRTEIMRDLGGYIPARKASDNEMRDRVSAYATSDVYQIAEPLIFMRFLPDSLSRSDFRAGWQHPARRAFWSSYRTWHATASPAELRRHAGDAEPIYVPPRFTSPPQETVQLDVVFAADWCELGQTQAADLEEIKLLLQAGYRVGVLHLENAVHLSEYARTYIQPIQELISGGHVAHVIADETFYDVKLVIVRKPELLQFMPRGRVGFIVQRLAVIAEQRALEDQEFLVRYIPSDCSQHAEDYFGVRPLWLAKNSTIRAQLGDVVVPEELSDSNFVAAFDPDSWAVLRRGPRNERPVLGRWAGEMASLWPNSLDEIVQIWPTDGRADVRFYGDPKTLLRVTGQKRLPAAWLSFRHNEISRRTYYRSIDFFVHYSQDGPQEAPDLPVLEALASGCIAVLPPQLKQVYGDAAVYARPEEVWATVARHQNDTEELRRQSQRGVEFAKSHRSSGYRELIDSLVDTSRTTAQEGIQQ